MRSFKNRLLFLIVALTALAQSVTIVLALAYLNGGVRYEATRQLSATRSVLDRVIDARAALLDSAARILVADFAFREAVASGDQATTLAALENNAGRIHADMAVIYGANGELIASTLPQDAGVRDTLRLPADKTDSQKPVFAVLDRRPFELVFVPLRATRNLGWVVLGFSLDKKLATELSTLADTEITFVVRSPGAPAMVVSTLPDSSVQQLTATTPTYSDEPVLTHLNNTLYLTLSSSLLTQNGSIDLLVQRSLDTAMAQFFRMRAALTVIGLVALLGAIILAWLVGRSAVRPLSKLVAAARQIEAGQYVQDVTVQGGAEFTDLARSFNAMQQGIRRREVHILQQASHDALTTLLNRRALREQLGELSDTHPVLSIALLDVQRFRDINASLGHQIGDLLLRQLAERLTHLSGQLRVARVGADQFAVVLPLHDSQTMHRMLILADELQQGVLLGEQRLRIALQMGISEWRAPRLPVDDWLRQADVALLEAKEGGPTAVCYQPSHDVEHRRRITLVNELRHSIATDGLTLAFQPLVQTTNREPVSFEALVRWTHPALGEISPSEFVPLAERALVISDLTRWVLSAAVKQLADWQRQGFQTHVAVNLSATDITDPSLIQFLLGLLAEHEVAPKQLLLEVTESAIMRDVKLAAQNMQQLRTLGIRFAIDDFGTGHSSLAQLHLLPVDEIKIDRAFVTNVDRSASNLAIVQATTELGHNLGLKVVAEGVETPEVWGTLLRVGCDLIQGYFVSRPLPAAEVAQWTKTQQANLSALLDEATQVGRLTSIRSRMPGL